MLKSQLPDQRDVPLAAIDASAIVAAVLGAQAPAPTFNSAV